MNWEPELEELRKEVEALRSSHDTALGEIHASLDNPLGGGFGETTPNFMMPLTPPTPTPIEGADDLRPASVAQPQTAAAVKPARKPRATKSMTPAKTPAKLTAKPPVGAKAPGKPKTKAAKVVGESS